MAEQTILQKRKARMAWLYENFVIADMLNNKERARRYHNEAVQLNKEVARLLEKENK